jgi:hypothetical protein
MDFRVHDGRVAEQVVRDRPDGVSCLSGLRSIRPIFTR